MQNPEVWILPHIRQIPLAPIFFEKIRDKKIVLFLQESEMMYKSAERAHGVGTPAEPEKEDLIAADIVVRDASVEISHVSFDSLSGCSSDQMLEDVSRPNPVVIDNHLINTER